MAILRPFIAERHARQAARHQEGDTDAWLMENGRGLEASERALTGGSLNARDSPFWDRMLYQRASKILLKPYVRLWTLEQSDWAIGPCRGDGESGASRTRVSLGQVQGEDE